MQEKTGLVSVTNGSNIVQGNASVAWSDLCKLDGEGLPTSEPISPLIFVVSGRNDSYLVTSIDLTNRRLTLDQNYVNLTGENLTYAITRDFTPNHQLPIINKGDIETATLLSRAFRKIDDMLGLGSSGSDLGPTITQVDHTFRVGNIVAFDGTNYVKAKSDSLASTKQVVGVVTSIAVGGDANTFTVKNSGYVTGIAATLTPGEIHYLSDSVDVNGDNVTTSSLSYVQKFPCLLAVGNHSAFYIGSSQSDQTFTGASAEAAGTSGLVPAPAAGDQTKFLCADSTWKNSAIGDHTLLVKSFAATGSPVAFPLTDTMSLVEALSSVEARVTVNEAAFKNCAIFDYTTPRTPQNFVVPAGVTKLRLELWSASWTQYGNSGFAHTLGVAGIAKTGSYCSVILKVTPGKIVSVIVGGTTSEYGDLLDTIIKLDGTTVLTALGPKSNANATASSTLTALVQGYVIGGQDCLKTESRGSTTTYVPLGWCAPKSSLNGPGSANRNGLAIIVY